MASSSPFGLSFQSGVATAYHLFPNRPIFNRSIIFLRANGYALQKQSDIANDISIPPYLPASDVPVWG